MEVLVPVSRRIFPFLYLSALVLLPRPMSACSCNRAHTPCYEVAAGSAVFTGRVISVSPAFLNRFNRSSRSDAGRVSQFYSQLESGSPEQNLQVLKETFRTLVTGLAPDVIQRLQDVKSQPQLLALFDSVLNHGSYVTLQIRTVFTAGGDDDGNKGTNVKDADDDGDDDDAGKIIAAGKLFSVWTPAFDCGVEFQTGETYLVYASMDEDTDMVETDTCMGTRRLSDAGDDLPYLSFLQADPKESSHLDGFVTSDSAVHANPPESDTMPSPVGGILIELKSDDAIRYTTSAKDGRFTFDGLAGDDYQLTGYTTEDPDPAHITTGPDALKIKAKACSRHVLLVRPG
jgi:hypothetical protein